MYIYHERNSISRVLSCGNELVETKPPMVLYGVDKVLLECTVVVVVLSRESEM